MTHCSPHPAESAATSGRGREIARGVGGRHRCRPRNPTWPPAREKQQQQQQQPRKIGISRDFNFLEMEILGDFDGDFSRCFHLFVGLQP